MAQKHAAPTQVSIAPLKEESALEQFVAQYWKPALAIGICVTAWVLIGQYRSEQAKASEDQSWNTLAGHVEIERVLFSSESNDSPPLDQAVDEVNGSVAGPWARAVQVRQKLNIGDVEGAELALNQLESDFPSHVLTSAQFDVGGEDESATTSIVANLRSAIESEKAWRAANPRLFGLPELPADSPKVKIVTSKGAITVGLFSERAPLHAENFLSNCKEGAYNGTRFHQVVEGTRVIGGDANSKSDNIASWGQGESEAEIERETNDLWHFPGVLAMESKPGANGSHDSIFYFTSGEAHELDNQNTVFGVVLEGMDVIEAMDAVELDGESLRPKEPISIESTEVL